MRRLDSSHPRACALLHRRVVGLKAQRDWDRVTLIRDGDALNLCVWRAASSRARRRGLLGQSEIGDAEGLLISAAGLIHTRGMVFPIDAVFCDRRGRVVKIRANLQPGTWLAGTLPHRSCLELAAGAAKRNQIIVGGLIRVA